MRVCNKDYHVHCSWFLLIIHSYKALSLLRLSMIGQTGLDHHGEKCLRFAGFSASGLSGLGSRGFGVERFRV